MKAIVHTKYGSPNVLRFEEVQKPIPGDDEVLIKIHAASITAGDVIVLKGEPFVTRLVTGLLEPKNKIPGKEMAGRVEAVGGNVTHFQPGDDVYGDLSVASWGAFAEYVSVPVGAIAMKPSNLTFEEAAAVPESALVALQTLRDEGKIQPGQKVLINGASGGVGSFAVQIAKSFGAKVTAVCSTRNLEIVRSIGADHVIDYTEEDFTQNGQRYDLILAANGYHPILDYRRVLSPEGIYVGTGGSMAQSLQASMMGSILSRFGSKKMGGMMVRPNQDDLVFMKELLEAGKVAPVIDSCLLNDGSLLNNDEQAIYSSIYEYEHTGWVPGYYSIARYHEDIDTVVIQFVSTIGGETWGTSNVIGGKATAISNIIYNHIVRILHREINIDE